MLGSLAPFHRLLVITNQCDGDLESVLWFELADVASELFNDNGVMD